MARPHILAFLLVVAVTACGTGAAEPDNGGPVRVVATTAILGDLLAPLADAGAEIESLMPNGADPHDWEPSARDVATLRDADLVVAVGLGLEEGIVDVLADAEADGVVVLRIAPLVDPLPFHDPRHDHDDQDLDPHVWLDPIRMKLAVGEVADALADRFPELAWDRPVEEITSELEAADALIRDVLSVVPEGRRRLVTGHDVLGYFADRYGFEVAGVLIPGGTTLADASSRDLAELIATLRESDLEAIFTETTVPASLAETVSAEVGRPIEIVTLHTAALGDPTTEAGSYPEMLVSNARRIADALGG